jgi:acyl-CoA synthetase (AMP-forming)/AMP-acid ligase II
MHSTVSCAEWLNLANDSVMLCSVPLFHATGMQNCMNMPVFIGATMAIMTRWDAKCAAHLIERHRVTTWVTVPTMLIDLLNLTDVDKFDLSSIAYLSGGGAAMPQAVAQQIEARWGIPYVEGYGLTETMAATHINPQKHSKQQCMGVPVFNTDSLVVDPETLKPLGQGETGEILVSGPQVFDGYWNAPEATREAFASIDGKRYLRTGDLGYVDGDGYFFVVDRLKLQSLACRSRGHAVRASRHTGSVRHRDSRSAPRRVGESAHRPTERRARDGRRHCVVGPRAHGIVQGPAHHSVCPVRRVERSSGDCCKKLRRKISERAIRRPEAKLFCCLSRRRG